VSLINYNIISLFILLKNFLWDFRLRPRCVRGFRASGMFTNQRRETSLKREGLKSFLLKYRSCIRQICGI